MSFSRLRQWIWPIHRSELRKFFPLFIMYALICFNYSLLRAAKDALVITAPSSGAEAIPFIKVGAILPMAFLATFLFTRLSNRFGRDRTFYIMISIFLGFFTLFAFVIYPCKEFLHPHALADKLQASCYQGFSGFIAMFRNWTFTAFYVMSELWGTMIMTVLFWGFANQVTKIGDAKRFYAFFGLGANVASIGAGYASASLSSGWIQKQIAHFSDPWGVSLMFITTLLVVIGIAIGGTYRWYCRSVIDPTQAQEGRSKPKIKMGMRKNFAYLAKSKYLICIAVIVLTYNVSLNMIEVVWKDQVKLLCPNPADYNAYMGRVMAMMGILSTFMAMFITGSSIRRFGWTFSAMITPVIMFVTGIAFFSFLLFKDLGLGSFATYIGLTPIAFGVLLGTIQNCLARSCKYTLFDATKEMSFIPLSAECKLKGKAAIDGVGSRIGKSGGSFFHSGLLIIFGSVSMSTPFIAVILLGVIASWIVATKSLGRQFKKLTDTKESVSDPDATDIPAADATALG